MYIENLCHRDCWFRLFVVFDPIRCTSASVLHNLIPKERAFIQERLEDPALKPLSLHPIFIPTLLIELLSREALQLLDSVHINSVRLYIAADLIADDRYKNEPLWLSQELDAEQHAEKSLQYEQRALILLEKMESVIKLASTLLSWTPDFDKNHMSSDLQSRFQSAEKIIQNRLQYLLDTLDLQMIRVRRTQGHTQLNRLGVSVLKTLFTASSMEQVVDLLQLELRNTTTSNKLSARISEQSRDIARETKRDSSAMKAIAVLTMFFLPGTFFAVSTQ